MHGSGHPINLEQVANMAESTDGVLTMEPVHLGSMFLPGGLPFPPGVPGNIELAEVMTGLYGPRFDAAADSNDRLLISWPTPDNFREVSAAYKWPELSLWVCALKHDTTGAAADNADLKLTANLVTHFSQRGTAQSGDPGSTAPVTLSTAATALLGDPSANTAEEHFTWYELDLSARLEAESKSVKPGSAFQIALSVNEAVGADLAVLISGIRIEYRRHFAYSDRSLRGI
jgi:hypothetical protein